MSAFRIFLMVAWLAITILTVYVITKLGFTWPQVYINDLLAVDWRSQFNTDLIIYLTLTSIWMYWRENSMTRGLILVLLHMNLGAMFGCAYLLWLTYETKGDVKALLIGNR